MNRMAAAVAGVAAGATLGVGLVIVLGRQPDPTQAQASAPSPRVTAPSTTVPETSEPVPADTAAPESATIGTPLRVVIPAIDVNADLVALGLNDDGSMEVPNFGVAGWYELGPRPGEPGPAVIAAHVDSVNGPDVFFRLRELSAGDKITVEYANGDHSTFVVDHAEQQLKENLPTERIWNDTDDSVLRLITCGGEFDTSERSYRSNLIVYAAAA